ncbi:hypothetical protein BU16DRAFT_622749 [Lophium mytilinum]|uniref:F-box domain-containing protein n=1 Tax=Lophium mytilinum TaxID=390894 RepID=A0A6A6QA04_9PEZI|nr:hypothetical protein BU16DRAFT_622749 [Lophium mytilinum]
MSSKPETSAAEEHASNFLQVALRNACRLPLRLLALKPHRTWQSITRPGEPNSRQASSQVPAATIHRDKRTYTDRKQQAAALHNATEASIHQLPTELLLMTRAYLSPASNMAMHQTCQKMMDIFTLFAGTFPLDEFNPESVWLETPQSARVWCNACERRHASNLFSATQRTRPPLERRCVGMNEAIRICEHQWLTFSQIAKSVHGEWMIQCEDATHNFTHWPDHWRPTFKICSREHEAQMKSWIPIITIPQGYTVSNHRLAAVLSESTEPICMHLSVYDPIIFNLVSKLIHARDTGQLKWYRSEGTPCVHDPPVGSITSTACCQWHVSTNENDFLPSQGAWISDWWKMDCRRQYVWGCPCEIKVFLRRLPGSDVEEVIMEVCRKWTHKSMDQDWMDMIGYGPGGVIGRPRSGMRGFHAVPGSAKPVQVSWAELMQREGLDQEGLDQEGLD